MLDKLSIRMNPGLIVAAIAFLVYLNSLGNGFTLDDHSVILNNPVLNKGIGAIFHSIDTTGDGQLLPYYRPVTYLTFLLEKNLHGFNPLLVRLLNVLLHSTNTYLVYQLTSILFKNKPSVPFIAALLFAIHPLQSEGVDFNAGGRNTLLACCLTLTAFIIQRSGTDKKLRYTILAALLYTAGLFSKESALMILPCIIWFEVENSGRDTQKRLTCCLRLMPYLAGTGLYLVLRWQTLSKLGIQTSIIPGFGAQLLESIYVTEPLGTRLIHNIYIIPRYALNIIWPVALSPRYVVPDDLSVFFPQLIVAWLIICMIVYRIIRRSNTGTIFGLIWIVLFWAPVSGIVIIPGSQLADRFLYIPAIGIWLITADQLSELYKRHYNSKKLWYCAGVLLCLMLAGMTVKRNTDWKNDLTLYSRFVQQYPENVHARVGLGKVYYGETSFQNHDLAEKEFEIAVTLEPNFPMIFTYLGNIKLNKGNLEAALYCYSKAMEVYPYDKEARVNRGITFEKLGNPKAALSDYLFFLSSPEDDNKLPGGREHVERRLRELTDKK